MGDSTRAPSGDLADLAIQNTSEAPGLRCESGRGGLPNQRADQGVVVARGDSVRR